MPFPVRAPLRRARAAALLGAILAAAAAPAAAAQLCEEPRAFCGAQVASGCRDGVLSGKISDEGDASCGAALSAFRACLAEAADCPGVVDQNTPVSPKELSIACATGDCADDPATPAIRQTGDTPTPPPDQR